MDQPSMVCRVCASGVPEFDDSTVQFSSVSGIYQTLTSLKVRPLRILFKGNIWVVLHFYMILANIDGLAGRDLPELLHQAG